MTSEFHEEEKRYAVVTFEDDVKNVTYLYFREGEWYLTEIYEHSWDHPELPASRYFMIRGFSGPYDEYMEEYSKTQKVQKKINIVKTNLGQLLDSMIFGGKNVKSN